MTTTITIADGHHVVRAGLRQLLERFDDFDVVGEAATGDETLAMVRDHHPDCVIMDVALPGIGGIEATRRIQRFAPQSNVIGISAHVDGPVPKHMLEAGACSYLSKSCTPGELVNAVRYAAHGERFINAEVARNLAVDNLGRGNSPLDGLSRRELEVLLMVSAAKTQEQIAERLSVSRKTVSTYRTRLCRKLDVTTDVELVHLALRYGLLDLAA